MLKNIIINLILCILLLSNNAKAGLSVFPTKIKFEGKDRYEEIIITNRSKKTETYRASLEKIIIDENNDITISKEDRPIKKMIRYSPRSNIRVKPSKSQTVRIMLRKPKDLKAGIYSTHIKIETLPEESLGIDAQSTENALGKGQIGLKLMPLMSFSVPVKIKHGNIDFSSKAEIESFEIDTEKNSVLVKLKKIGLDTKKSKIKIIHRDKNNKVLSVDKNIALPSYLDKINITIDVDKEYLNLKNKKIEVIIEDREKKDKTS